MPWRHPTRALFLAMLVNLLLVCVVAWFTITTIAANCDRRVETRQDGRAMWIWLAEQFPGDDIADRALVELDRQLPELRCDWWRPIPLTPNLIPEGETP